MATVGDPTPAAGASVTVTAQLSCAGGAVANIQMKATANYPGAQSTCIGTSDASGSGSCVVQLPGARAGAAVTVEACLGYQGQQYCGRTEFTPR